VELLGSEVDFKVDMAWRPTAELSRRTWKVPTRLFSIEHVCLAPVGVLCTGVTACAHRGRKQNDNDEPHFIESFVQKADFLRSK